MHLVVKISSAYCLLDIYQASFERNTRVILKHNCQIRHFIKKKIQKKTNYTRTCSQTFLYKEKTDLKHFSPVTRFTVWEDACLEEEDLEEVQKISYKS